MTLTKSYHNSFRQWWSVYTWSLKKQSGIGIIYLILLCLALPFLLGIILFSSIKNQHMLTGENIANGLHILFTFLIIPGTLLFVFITAVLLFRFMHNKRSTDFYHALPVSRTAMFFGRFLAGFTILAVPMVICCCITAIVLVCVQGTANILGMPYGTLFLYLLYLLIIILITYAFTVFIAVCSGTTFNAIISAVAIGVAYPIFMYLLIIMVNSLLPGFTLEGFTTILTAGSPYMASFVPVFFIAYTSQGITMSADMIAFFVWWACITVVMIVASWLLYRARKSENAEGRKAYPVPQIIIRTVVSGAVGIGLGYILFATLGGTVAFFAGVVIGAVIAHIIIEVLYARGFRTLLKSLPYLAGFLVLFGIYYAILATGCFGYDTKVPLANQVESIDLDLDNTPANEILDVNGKTIGTVTPVHLQDRTSIEAVISWHQATVDENREKHYPYQMSDHIFSGKVTYHLKDGSTLTRTVEYFRDLNTTETNSTSSKRKEQKDLLKNQEEYIKKSNLIFYVEPQALNTITVVKGNADSGTYITEEGQKEILLQMLQQDIMRTEMNQSHSDSKKSTLQKSADTEIDENTILLTIDTKSFIPSQNSIVRQLTGAYNGQIRLSQTSFPYVIDESDFPNTYQYLLDNGFLA